MGNLIQIMEMEILVAVVATGLGVIGGMLVIWRGYKGHPPEGQSKNPPQQIMHRVANRPQEKMRLRDQPYVSQEQPTGDC